MSQSKAFFLWRLSPGAWGVIKEIGRHILRRPVVGIVAIARTPDGKLLLIKRADTGTWAMPGGTLEWGEQLRPAIERELLEEAGAKLIELGEVAGVYSAPHRDFRFHAVTVVVHAKVEFPSKAPLNPAEILEVSTFTDEQVPYPLAHESSDMLRNALQGHTTLE